MKVVQITAWDTLGERFNGTLIHRALLARGHRSSMIVRFKSGHDPSVHTAGNRWTRNLDNRVLTPLQERLSLQSILPTSASASMLSRPCRRSHIVHLHLVHASPFFSLLNAPIIGRTKSLVWTIHDPWMLTGHCVHPLACDRWRTGCGECPDLERSIPMRRDRSALMWRIKKSVIHRSRPTLVVASRYMQKMVSESPIFRNLPLRLIPFGVSNSIFRSEGREEARARYDIPPESHVLAFRFCGLEDPHKGGQSLIDALRTYRPTRPTTLVVLDRTDGVEELSSKYTVRQLGWVNEPPALADALRAADLFLMPSAAEAFGMMAVEAMACGTPVVACEGTSLPDVIMAPRGGVVVPQNEPAMLADAIDSLLNSPGRRREIGKDAERIAREHYSEEAYIDRHLELYGELWEARQ
jgi:glycosyltransferase involved in cell wall biosynthesis